MPDVESSEAVAEGDPFYSAYEEEVGLFYREDPEESIAGQL